MHSDFSLKYAEFVNQLNAMKGEVFRKPMTIPLERFDIPPPTLYTGRPGSSEVRPCLNVEIESVHRICLVTDSVDRFYFGSKRPYWEMRRH